MIKKIINNIWNIFIIILFITYSITFLYVCIIGNSDNKVKATVNLGYSGVDLTAKEEVLAETKFGPYSNYLVGTQSATTSSKYNYKYIYIENKNNFISKKIIFPQKLLGNLCQFKNLGHYILTSIATDKVYDSQIIKVFLYSIDNQLDYSLIDCNSLYTNLIQVNTKGTNLEITRENANINIPLDTLNKDLVSNLTYESRRSFGLRGLTDVNIFKRDDITYLESSYSIYNKSIMPVLNLATVNIHYKIEKNQLIFVNMDSEIINTENQMQKLH